MKNEQFQILLRFFKALADESRLKIVGILASQECSVEELAALLELKEPTVSHHLSRLKELNLVSMRPDGNAHLYQLDSDTLQNISKEIFMPEKMASLVQEVNTEAWEQKILRTYIDGDSLDSDGVQRLKDIPARVSIDAARTGSLLASSTEVSRSMERLPPCSVGVAFQE